MYCAFCILLRLSFFNARLLFKLKTYLKNVFTEASDVKINFPVLSEIFLRDITFGIHQLEQAVNDVNEHVSAQGSYEFSVNQNENILNLIQCHVKIQPRHASSKKYNCWIEKGQTDRSPISGWFCGCKVGARTVWCCAHDAFVL